jgi:hypothetical protein
MFKHLESYFNSRKIKFSVIPGIGLQFERNVFNYDDFKTLIDANRVLWLDQTFIVTVQPLKP